MIFKYNFSVFGDTFYPESIIQEVKGDFIIDSFFKPTDKKFEESSDEYGYGGISFWHPQKFSTEDKIENYEKEFVDFIEINYSLFIKNGVKEFEIYIEIYFDGEQCNFEIFNKDIMNKLGNIGVSLPTSIYVLKSEEIQKWEDEIKIVWNSR